MRSAKLVFIATVTALSVGGARAGDSASAELELCIQTARDADANCAKLEDDPTRRLECFRKARGEQLDCLEHALADVSPPTTTSENQSGALPSEPSNGARSSDATSQDKAQGTSQESKASQEKAPQAAPQIAEPGSTTSPAQAASAPEATPAPEAKPVIEAQPIPEAKPVVEAKPVTEPKPVEEAKPVIEAKPVQEATPAAKSKTAAVQSEAPLEGVKEPAKEMIKTAAKPNSAQASPTEFGWVISETTSPVDYRPQLAAVIRPTSNSQDGASSLAIRCRGGRTEFVIRTDGSWHAPRNNVLMVDRQVNDQAAVRQKWILAADGKTATYADDAVELLRSLPDGARLKLAVADATDARHDATFSLGGWDAVRKRVEAACKWPKATDEALSGKR